MGSFRYFANPLLVIYARRFICSLFMNIVSYRLLNYHVLDYHDGNSILLIPSTSLERSWEVLDTLLIRYC